MPPKSSLPPVPPPVRDRDRRAQHGQRLRLIRARARLSLAEVADKLAAADPSRPGVSWYVVARWENRSDIHTDRVAALTRVLGCTYEELFDLSQPLVSP